MDVIMARLKRKALKAHKEKHEAWQKHAKAALKAGRKPIKFKDYEKEPVYYGKFSKPTVESRLKAAKLRRSKKK
jgi:hypothetical protein